MNVEKRPVLLAIFKTIVILTKAFNKLSRLFDGWCAFIAHWLLVTGYLDSLRLASNQ
ncbi:MAG: hypothetical protein HY231_22025 [Acidobacteria bacterium]|nr:hypothetical protein [Acidobacteriota bacterium]